MEYIDYQRLKEEVNQREPDFLPKAPKKINGFDSYICPCCGNGSGKNGTGIVLDINHTNKGRRYKCFKCQLNEDVIGLYMKYSNISDFNQGIRKAAEYFKIDVKGAEGVKQVSTDKELQQKPKEKKDYTNFFLKANKNLPNTEYHRGISLDTLNKYKVGYVPDWEGLGGKFPRLIIPTSKYTFVARDTTDKSPYKVLHIGANRLFNGAALADTDRPVFVVEGELDALSLLDVGYSSIAIGGTSNTNLILQAVKECRPKQPLIIAMDSDAAGKQAQEAITSQLLLMDIPFVVYQWQKKKDANELLMIGKEQLQAQAAEAVKQAEVSGYEYIHGYLDKITVAAHLQEFVDGIAASVNTNVYPTGFANLDEVLGGGLYKGVTLLGAIPSLGKTTLALQIADNVAASGKNVLIFSLEMERGELMAKSISRNTLLECMEKSLGNIARYAKTQRGITDGWRYREYDNTSREIITAAINRYEKYASRLAIVETDEIKINEIKEEVKKYIKITGALPLVVIDYIQIIAPSDSRITDKQHLDQIARGLKRLSRDCKVPILAISSFNRENYSKGVNLTSFKESGGLEYGADVIIGLQLKGVGSKDFDVDKAKQNNPREIEAVILKQRSGKTGDTLDFEYYPKYNYMEAK